VALSVVGLVVTSVAVAEVGRELIGVLTGLVAAERWGAVALHVLFCTIVAALIYGGVVYQLTRALYYWRECRHVSEPAAALEALRTGANDRWITILIPSFKEEPRVVLRTLLSAAFQTYPRRRVALLIDDAPFPAAAADRASLEEARRLPDRLAERLQAPRAWIDGCTTGEGEEAPDAEQVRDVLGRVTLWFERLATEFDRSQHEERLFVDRVLLEHAERCRRHAQRLSVCRHGALHAERRTAWHFLRTLFDVEVRTFERKAFDNLSHEPNKAMNLNSYIGLMGKSFRVLMDGTKRLLIPAPASIADFHVPDSDYLITLDADSIILPDYALRLVHFLEQPGHERVAVVQTPYSAFPGAPGRLERLAGATTDIQYIIHQGFTACSGTYWVGANALLRKRALDAIAEGDVERGYRITRYIQDRTVIEDTESSIDLVMRGWSLHNYPERLAYSATPPDFGALLIQRRRWANGGLIILPKLLKYLGRRAVGVTTWLEAVVRVHYLVSITAVNFGLLIVLAVPFTENIRSWWLPVTALPYFALYARDLQLVGYRARDLFGVYALNLLLIPVNLGGVLKSIHQLLTGQKTPFARTPKVEGRTAAAAIYVLAVYGLVLHWLVAAGFDFSFGRVFHGAFALVNAAFMGYAAVRLIGLRESWVDLRTLRPTRFRDVLPRRGRNRVPIPSRIIDDPELG